MRGRLVLVALLLPACSDGVLDSRALCEQAFPGGEVTGAAVTTVGEVRARLPGPTPEMRGYREWELWPGKSDDDRAVWCYLWRRDGAVTPGEKGMLFPRGPRAGR